MKLKAIVATSTCAIIVAGAIAEYRLVRQIERAKRAKIQLKLIEDIKAIGVAEERMLQRIRSGRYDGDLNTLMQDIDFEFMRAHYE